MTGSFQHRLVLTVAVCAFAGGCAPLEPATRVRGKFVDVHADLSRPDAWAVATEADGILEQVSAYLSARKPRPKLYVFKSGWRLRRYLRKECPTFSWRTGACFVAEDGRLVVAVKSASGGRAAQKSLRHELTHAVIGANFSAPMPWVDEGLAQVMESGSPPVEAAHRTEKLLRHDRSSIGRRARHLLNLSAHTELDENDYLVAWGFVWFLLNDEAFGKEALLKCLGPPMAGESIEQRCERSLGQSAEQLAARFWMFLESRRRKSGDPDS